MVHVKLPFTILEKLAKLEKRRSLEEKFGNDASNAEDIHGFGHPTILLTLNILASKFRLLGTNLGILACCVKSFRCNITSSAPRGVKVEREVGRVVEWEVSRLVGSEIGYINPVPGGNEDVFTFDISMRNLAVASIAKSREYLECDPFLLDS